MILVVIDLGSNTFHILIAQITPNRTFQVIYKERLYTKLVEAGIGKIGKLSFKRGLSALEHFKDLANKYHADVIRAIGTSVLRESSNGALFINKAREDYNLDIQVIDGEREGELIQKGVNLALDRMDITIPYLILDIGGGSVEFIIVKNGVRIYNKSFLIGMSILHSISDISDGATESDLSRINIFIERSIAELLVVVEKIPRIHLVGSAGAFEVLASMTGLTLEKSGFIEMSLEIFRGLYTNIIYSNREERLNQFRIPAERLDYIGVAFQLIKFVVDKINPEKMIISEYALKEGIIAEYLD